MAVTVIVLVALIHSSAGSQCLPAVLERHHVALDAGHARRLCTEPNSHSGGQRSTRLSQQNGLIVVNVEKVLLNSGHCLVSESTGVIMCTQLLAEFYRMESIIFVV